METPFQYDKPAIGKNFIGRKTEAISLESMLRSGQNALIFDAPKSGKGSLIRQVLYNLKINSYPFIACRMDLTRIRAWEDFLNAFATSVFRAAVSGGAEMNELHGLWLQGTFLGFDPTSYNDTGMLFTAEGKASDKDSYAILSLPEKAAARFGLQVIVIIEEFQDFMLMDGWEDILDTLEIVWGEREKATYIFSGSMINAMKKIFMEEKRFYRFAEYLPLSPINEREITDYILKGFLKSGKVIEKDLALGTARLFECNCWYINQLLSICDSLSRGYITENTMMDSLGMLISIHEPRFIEKVNGMTGFQLNFFRAVLEGYSKFSSKEVIEKFGLNSSANVLRVKDALKKKEIIAFDDDENPHIIDPLFRYWMKTCFYKI